jgi:hypothetical protein
VAESTCSLSTLLDSAQPWGVVGEGWGDIARVAAHRAGLSAWHCTTRGSQAVCIHLRTSRCKYAHALLTLASAAAASAATRVAQPASQPASSQPAGHIMLSPQSQWVTAGRGRSASPGG